MNCEFVHACMAEFPVGRTLERVRMCRVRLASWPIQASDSISLEDGWSYVARRYKKGLAHGLLAAKLLTLTPRRNLQTH